MALNGASPSPGSIPRRVQTKEAEEDELPQRLNETVPPASRAGARGPHGDSMGIEPASRQGGMGMGIGLCGLDEQIEACDGTPATTRRLLEPIITRPKLSDKLLGKPPFRFLHDIVTEVIQQTKFASGLYSESEADSSNVTDKIAKVKYLEKMVRLVGMQLNTIVEARPARIVSGLEPNNTNRLLQLMAVAATSAPDSSAAVEAVLASEEMASETPLPDRQEAKNHGEGDSKHEPDHELQQAAQAKDADSKDHDHMSQLTDENDMNSALPKRSTRPTTARRRPPKYKDKNLDDEENKEPDRSVKSAIMMDGEQDDEDHASFDSKAISAEVLNVGGKSRLVREIQEEERSTAKSTEGELRNAAGGIRFGRIDHAVAGGKSKVSSEANLFALQRSIQILCQSTNPLGKCMDYVHEDLSIMNKEYERWEQDYKTRFDELDTELKLTTETTRPLKLRLKEFDDRTADEQKKMRGIGARVLKQEERIEELLRMVCSNSRGRTEA
mmetsp:Transcript_3917/g.11820  ORF Transcript_3917/g.11820 Transcript_3917/m.11820 type:complete len:499 (+) Transcript_3917:449-1945(+)